jgi:hypothetical protein
MSGVMTGAIDDVVDLIGALALALCRYHLAQIR